MVVVVVVEAAVAATLAAAGWHAAASLVPGWPRAAFLVPECALAVRILTVPAHGTAATSLAVTSMPAMGAVAIIGMAITGTEVNGIIIGEIRTADGVGGTVTSGVIPGTTSCSLAVLAFRGGGAGAGALGQEAGAGTTATHTTATAIILMDMVVPTPTGTVTAVTHMVTDTARSISPTTVSTVIAANPESPSCNDDCHGLAITMDPSMESSGRRLVAQSAITNKQTAT